MKSYFSFILLPLLLVLIPPPVYRMPDERILRLYTDYESVRIIFEHLARYYAVLAMSGKFPRPVLERLMGLHIWMLAHELAVYGVSVECGLRIPGTDCEVVPFPCGQLAHLSTGNVTTTMIGGIYHNGSEEVILFKEERWGASYCAPITVSVATTDGHQYPSGTVSSS